MSDIIKFSIPGKPDYVQMVRLAIGSISSKAGFDVEEVEDIKVAVSEACKNVFCHGEEGFSASYDVTCEIVEEKMTIVVEDNCGQREMIHGEKPCKNCPEEGMLAIHIIKTLMDEAELITGENKRIRMVKNRC